ncbi:MAG: aldo/keto reductase [Spirochaetaceae bacterium]|jgi:predicted oxidoreductase|nr:aldo/keto reductase [Spirochaetaceae bacterium]
MRTLNLGMTGLDVPVIGVGCMRINSLNKEEADTFVRTALDLGANFFDNADIYGDGHCEETFTTALHKVRRRDIFIQTKCGIKPGVCFDFSKSHIIKSVELSLERLRTDYIDVLLLHRPDALMDEEEVAEAFAKLQLSGKVRFFGVSNQNPGQIALLKKYVKQPLVANQLQFSIAHAGMISEGLHVNMLDDAAVNRSGGVLDYCRLHDITVQPWSPFQYGFFEGPFLGSPKFPELNKVIDEIAEKYQVSSTTIALAWILRHPAKMQPIVGTMNPKRLEDCVKAAEITLSREEWYAIYMAAGNILP